MRSPINPAGVAHYNVPLHDSARPGPPGPHRPAASPQPGPAAPCRRHELIQHAACEEVAGRHSRQRGDNVPIKAVSCQSPTSTTCPAEAGPPHSGPVHLQPTWMCPTGVPCPPRVATGSPGDTGEDMGGGKISLRDSQPLSTILAPGGLASAPWSLGRPLKPLEPSCHS